MKSTHDVVKNFLLKNGFTMPMQDTFTNGKCDIGITQQGYKVYIVDDDGFMYSENHEIYWLIGLLTCHGLIDKNYKQ